VRLLLDTHIFLWFIQGNDRLSNTARLSIEDPKNQKLISVASLWEIAIKVSINKLEIGMSISDLVTREVFGNTFSILQIDSAHLDKLEKLTFHHKDPFDRLIIAQSMAENISIISQDKIFSIYPVQLIC